MLIGEKELRDYQEGAANAALMGFTSEIPEVGGPFDKQMVVLPTGSGKTVIFSAVADYVVDNWKRPVLILVDQTDLIDQAINEIVDWTSQRPQPEQGDRHADLGSQIVVATVQSMAHRLDKYPADNFGLVIADECDRSVAPLWQKVLNHFDKTAKVLGVTATPDRCDQRSVMDYYERIAYEVDLFDLINRGYLSKIMVHTVPLKIDVSMVKQSQGDYDREELDAALTPYFGEVCEAILQYAPERKTLVFLPLIATSEKFVEIARSHGIKAAHIDGASDDRESTKQAFRDRKIDLLANAMLLGRGYNDRSIDCVVNLRPTRSATLYRQFVGRGTRTYCPHGCHERCDHPDRKTDLLLLDFLWTFHRLGLQRPANLVARDPDQAKRLTDYSQRAKGQLDLQGIDSKVARETEALLLKSLMKGRTMPPGFFDAAAMAVALHQRDLIEYQPVARWERKPPSENQLAALEKMGFGRESIENFGHAHKLMDFAMERRKKNLATFKQLKLLRKFGVAKADQVTFVGASALIDQHMNGTDIPEGTQLYNDCSEGGGGPEASENAETAMTAPHGLADASTVAQPPGPKPIDRKVRVRDVDAPMPEHRHAPQPYSADDAPPNPSRARQETFDKYFGPLKAKLAAMPDPMKKR
jgi:superfamily II DNA or RNA helicase